VLSELESHITHDKFVHNIETFMKSMPAQITELQSLVHTSDTRRIADTAHMLKGTCGQFGAMRLHELFKTIENCAEQGRLCDVESMVHVLPYEFQLVHELIDLSYMNMHQPQQSPRARGD